MLAVRIKLSNGQSDRSLPVLFYLTRVCIEIAGVWLHGVAVQVNYRESFAIAEHYDMVSCDRWICAPSVDVTVSLMA